MAGYSGTPLAKKLGITGQAKVALIDEPEGTIGGLPPTVSVTRAARGKADVVVAFFIRRADYERRLVGISRMIFPDGGAWIAWPKQTSGVPTTMSEHVIREVALPMGLVDNKVCAINDTWSGLRLVWRREHRG